MEGCLLKIARRFQDVEKMETAVQNYLISMKEADIDITKWWNNVKNIAEKPYFFGVLPEDVAGELHLQFCNKRNGGLKASFYMRLSNTHIGWISITNGDGVTRRWDTVTPLPEGFFSYINENPGFKVFQFDGGFLKHGENKGDCGDFWDFLMEYKKGKK